MGARKPQRSNGTAARPSPADDAPGRPAASAAGPADPAANEVADGPYRTLFMEAPEAYVVTTIDGIIRDLNHRAARLFETEPGDLIGRHVSRLADIDRAEYARRAATLENDGQATFMGAGRRADGSAFAQQVTIRRVTLEGEPRDLVHVRDTTEPDRLQAELLQAQKMEALGQLVAGAAHELNNPLQAIIGFSRLMSTDPALPAELRSDAELLVVEATRTRRIVDNLLDFARQRPPERHPTRLGLLVQSVLDLQSYDFSGSVAVEVDIPEDLPPVPLDRAMMQQVILNLTQNAVQAMRGWRDHGTIRISASTGSSGTGARVARLSVTDDGPGVLEEHRDRLFLPFFTTKPPGEGTGLGLSVSFSIVAGHGGRLWFEPGPEGGSVFTIELPLEPSVEGSPAPGSGRDPTRATDDETAPGAAPRRVASGTGGGRSPAGERRLRLLVLDDVESIRTFLTRALGGVADVVVAETGTEALGLIEAGEFDGILCDHRMPGLSGTEVYERVAALRPELARHFILMSGDVLNPELLVFAKRRAMRLVSKPIDIETLQAVVAELGRDIGVHGP